MRRVKLIDIGDVLLRQRNVERAGGVEKVFFLRGADDGRRDPLFEVPCERDLRHACSVLLRKFADARGDGFILLLRFIVLAAGDNVRFAAQGVRRPVGTGTSACGERAVRRERDVHLSADGDELAFVLAVERVVVILHGDEGREPVVARADLHVVKLIAVHGGGAERANFPRLHKTVERLHRLFHGRGIVETVDDIEIEIIGAEAL